jgi:hypothetical protein
MSSSSERESPQWVRMLPFRRREHLHFMADTHNGSSVSLRGNGLGSRIVKW